jgi:hypothetical protein
MATLYQPAAPVNTPPALRLIQDEQAPSYDGQPPTRRESFYMIPREVFLEYARRAKPVAWAVFEALVCHASPDGTCFPSHSTLAEETGISRRETIISAVARLVELGMIRVESRTTESGAKTSNQYVLLVGIHVRQTVQGMSANAYKVCPPNRTGYVRQTVQEQEPVNKTQLTKEEKTPLPPKGEKQTRSKPTPEPVREGFDRWYDAYPRHTDRKAAERAWSRLPKDAPDADALIAAVERQRIAEREWRFRPHPSTWLNGEKWTDETPADEQPRSPNGNAPNLTPAERSLRNIDRAFAQMGVPDRQPAGDVIDVNGVER